MEMPTRWNLTGGERLAIGPKPAQVTARQDPSGSVTLHVEYELRNPYQPFGQGVVSDVDITISKDASTAEIRGVISGSPAFEANFAVDSELRGACFPPQNVPIQDAARTFRPFYKNLQSTNQVDTKAAILP